MKGNWNGLNALIKICLITLLVCAGTVPTSTAQETTAPAPELCVISFNIRFDNPADGTDAWLNRKEMVARLIVAQAADLVGMQEVLESQLRDLEEGLSGYAWFGVGRDDGQAAGEFCPVFYRDDLFSLPDHGTFWLSETPEVPGSLGWDAACRRIVTWGKLRHEQSFKTFFLFNTHFDHMGRQARLESARLLLTEIEKIAGDEPVIVTGDFNCRPDSEAYAVLTDLERSLDEQEWGGLQDAYNVALDGHWGPRWSFHGFTGRGEEGARIDYIFVRNGVRVKRHTLLDYSDQGRYPSDHLPVVVQAMLLEQQN
jgi:endonuclease/exonuclease/phosphatase family metal-dependent hydrolase